MLIGNYFRIHWIFYYHLSLKWGSSFCVLYSVMFNYFLLFLFIYFYSALGATQGLLMAACSGDVIIVIMWSVRDGTWVSSTQNSWPSPLKHLLHIILHYFSDFSLSSLVWIFSTHLSSNLSFYFVLYLACF